MYLSTCEPLLLIAYKSSRTRSSAVRIQFFLYISYDFVCYNEMKTFNETSLKCKETVSISLMTEYLETEPRVLFSFF